MTTNRAVKLPRPAPEPCVIEGRYTQLEPLWSAHARDLFEASGGPENASRFDYLFEEPPGDLGDIQGWIDRVASQDDPMFFAVVNRATGRCEGRQALMGIRPEHGSIELGAIYWGPAIARTRMATEAVYLHLHHAFETLGYRRFEWKCNNSNEASKRAAMRFGFTFEGVFRQHMFTKGANRDTAWYSIIDSEWPGIRAAYEHWLRPANFTPNGNQLTKLAARSCFPVRRTC